MTAATAPLNAWLEAEAIRLTPPNKLWYIQRWLDNSKVFWRFVILAFLAGFLIAFLLVPADILGISHTTLDYVTRAIVVVMFGGTPVFIVVFVPLVVIIVGVRDPAAWHRYSLADFKRIWDYKLPVLTQRIRDIRAVSPEAEFEAMVLDHPNAKGIEEVLIIEKFDKLDNVHVYMHPQGGKIVLRLDGQFNELPLPSLG